MISQSAPEKKEPQPYRIRRAEKMDLERVMQIEHESFPTPWPYDLLAQHMCEDGFLVAEIEAMLIGYIIVGMKVPSLFSRLERRTLQLLRGEELPEPEVGHVMNIAVDPRFRRHGLGRELLRHGMDYLKNLGADEIELEVRVDNEPAIALYNQFGFEVKERICNYYSNGDDAFLMNAKVQP
ncbi:GNAT family N-acetyltransferase [Candidatus Acetothermia bacterium]|nr:GNAT family N-acetyltransferase [Candidatus Acetothermia bacterium]